MSQPRARSSLFFQLAALLCVLAGLGWCIKSVAGGDNRVDIPIGMMWIVLGMAFLAISRRKNAEPPTQ